jgi:hypothetical protein
MRSLVTQLVGKRASEINPEYKINCFATVVSYFRNRIQDGSLSAQKMLEWLQINTKQVHKINEDTIVIIWTSSNPAKSPSEIKMNELIPSAKGYPFGLIMEHAAIFLKEGTVFQKASSEDEDKFEIIPYTKMIGANFSNLQWMRVN